MALITDDWDSLRRVDEQLVKLAQQKATVLAQVDERMSLEELIQEADKFGYVRSPTKESEAKKKESQKKEDPRDPYREFLRKKRAAQVNDLFGREPSNWPQEVQTIHEGLRDWSKAKQLVLSDAGRATLTLAVVRNGGKWFALRGDENSNWEGKLRGYWKCLGEQKELSGLLYAGNTTPQNWVLVEDASALRTHDSDIDRIIQKLDEIEPLRRCLQSCLTKDERRLLELRYVQEWTFEELCRMTELSVAATWKRHERALAKLRRCMTGQDERSRE